MHPILKRSPSGKFISPDSALYHWLPVLMDALQCGRSLDMHRLLSRAIKLCREYQAQQLEYQAKCVRREFPTDATYYANQAAKHEKRRLILEESLRKLEEIR